MSLPQGSLTEKGEAVLTAVADGEMAPDQGATMIGALGTLARVAELDDLKRRIEALEKAGEKT
jgi:CO/xanthine dehydrogenase FAD-binding subunit